MSLLEEMLAKLEALPEDARREATAMALKGTSPMIWVPNSGPQEQAFKCEADELYFGGEAAGGKTFLGIGLALTKHKKSLLLRRYIDDARGLIEKTMSVLGHDRGLNRQLLQWRHPGPHIDFGGCQLETDKQRYKGDAHDFICVAGGTQVLLANGKYCRVERLRRGQRVQTLEGPKPITRIYPSQRKQCVEVIARDPSGNILGKQIQSTTHELLTDSGWSSAAFLAGTYAPTRFHGCGTLLRLLRSAFGSLLPHPLVSIYYWKHIYELYSQLLGRLHGMARIAFYPLSIQGICGEEYYDRNVMYRRPALSFVPLRRLQPYPELSGVVRTNPFFCCDKNDARSLSLLEDSTGDCLFGTRRYGGHTLKSLDFSTSEARGQQCLLLRDDAEQPTPKNWRDDDPGETRRCTRLKRMYAHPYTKEIRQVSVCGWLPCAALEVSYVGEKTVYDLQVEEVNHYITRGGFINKNCFDEAADFLESQIDFINIWNRSDDPKQRCRIVYASNPPMTAAGLWLIKRFAAWLDPKHPHPAKVGELRWYLRGLDEKEVEVDGPGPYSVGKEMIRATSRTFIRSRLEDNPDYFRSGYKDRLHLAPPDLRAAYREGKFDVGLRDQPNQIIPTAWVLAAQKRWTPAPPQNIPMVSMGIDCSGGGQDPMIISRRYDWWFDELIEIPGKDLPSERMGKFATGTIVSYRKDGALIVLDMGGGYGGAIYENLSENKINVLQFKGGEGTAVRTKTREYGFYNVRSAAIWKFREALDPDQDGGSPIALSQDQVLLADLTAPTFEIGTRGIQAEPKEDIVKRLGRSTDRGDATIMSWFGGGSFLSGQRMPTRNIRPEVVTNRMMRMRGNRRW